MPSRQLNQLQVLKARGLRWVCLHCGGAWEKRTLLFEPQMSCEGGYRDDCPRCHCDLVENIDETIKRFEEKETPPSTVQT